MAKLMPQDDGFGRQIVAMNPITEQIYYEGPYDGRLWHLDYAVRDIVKYVENTFGPIEINKKYDRERRTLTIHLV